MLVLLTKRGLLARLAIIIFGIFAALAFWQVSGTINVLPSAAPFPGWLAVLQPARTALDSQVELRVEPLIPGGSGTHPALGYSVVACGHRSFRGVLLMGGDARLTKPHMVTPIAGVSLSRIIGSELFDPGTNQAVKLGTVQALRFTLPAIGCDSHFSPNAAASGISGMGLEIAGFVGSPVQQRGRYGLWDGPRTTQSWPLIGSPPGISTDDLGEWKLVGLPGSWGRPWHEYMQLDAGGLTTVGSLEAARPQLLDVSTFSWTSTHAFQASARVLNAGELSTWQNRLVAVTILLTVGASLFAAVLFDLVPPVPKGRHRNSVKADEAQAVIDVGSSSKESDHEQARRLRFVLVLLGVLGTSVLARRRRHSNAR
jgi:hypothetical protein